MATILNYEFSQLMSEIYTKRFADCYNFILRARTHTHTYTITLEIKWIVWINLLRRDRMDIHHGEEK